MSLSKVESKSPSRKESYQGAGMIVVEILVNLKSGVTCTKNKPEATKLLSYQEVYLIEALYLTKGVFQVN